MPIFEGLNKSVIYKKETTWGVLAGPSSGKLLRRVQATANLTKDTYASEEIRVDRQINSFSHGIRMAEANLQGELSPTSYADFFAAAVSRDFTAGATTGVIAAMNLNGTTRTATRGAGSYLADGLKVGDVFRATGFTTPANNARNLLITALTATILTFRVLDGGTLANEPTATSVTFAVTGKKTLAPLTGHTDDSFTIEESYLNSAGIQSEVYTGMKINTLSVDVPATGIVGITADFMGKDMALSGPAQYFTTPAALPVTNVTTAVNGAVLVNGIYSALITSLDFSINRNVTGEAVVGSNTRPDLFEGKIDCQGSFSAFFEDGVYRDYFFNETEISLTIVLTTSGAVNADCVVFNFPRVKVGSADKDDGEKGIVRSFSFQALLNSTGGAGTASDNTTISIQDTTA